MSHEHPNNNNRIHRIGPQKHQCTICNKELNHPYSIRRCQYFSKILCKQCLEYGLCSEHYQVLNDQDKEFFKKKYRPPGFYHGFSTILIFIFLGLYVIFKLNILPESEQWVTILIITVEIAFALFFIISTILQIRYWRKDKPSLNEIIKKYKDMDRSPDFIKITSVDTAFEKILNFYRSDERFRAVFEDRNLTITVKFADTKRVYTIKIQKDGEISLDPNPSLISPDFRFNVKTEQLLLDMLNKDVPLEDGILSRQILIGKGVAKFARLLRKAQYKIGNFGRTSF
ncbi:MAG: hypothetical protein ACTSRD_11415 [Promethearchaeota archaeon]